MPLSSVKWNISSRLIVGAIVVLTLVLTFNWDWFRPAVERYVSYKSHRMVKADEMQVTFSGALHPTLKFRNLYIQNAPWSSQRPLIAGKEVSFAFAALRWPYSEKPGVVEISISDGEANLERMQDGLRNWRLLKPDYRGPGKYLVMALTAKRSSVRFTDHSTSLNLVAQSSDVLAQASGSKIATKVMMLSAAEAYANHITFSGTFHDQEFKGEAITGPRLTFQKTGKAFPIDGTVHSGKMEVLINGKVGDIFKNQIADADIHFSTPSVSALNPLLNSRLPNSPPLDASSHLIKTDEEYHVSDLQGKLGETDIAGNLTYIYHKPDDKNPSSLKGSLTSNEVHIDDLLSIKPDQAKTVAATNDLTPSTPDHAFSSELLKSQDLDVSLKVHKVISSGLPPIDNLTLKTKLDNGNLTIAPIQATVFESTLKAEFSLNAQNRPMSAHIQIDAPDIAVNELLAKTKLRDMIVAPLTAHININGIGDTPPQILASAKGNMDFTIAHGEISDKLDAKMGLDLGKLAWLSIRGDKKIAVDKGAVHFVFNNGMGQSRDSEIETSQTIVQGTGNIDLRHQTLALVLTPKPKDPSIFTLDSNIRVEGPLTKPRYKLEHRTLAANSPRP